MKHETKQIQALTTELYTEEGKLFTTMEGIENRYQVIYLVDEKEGIWVDFQKLNGGGWVAVEGYRWVSQTYYLEDALANVLIGKALEDTYQSVSYFLQDYRETLVERPNFLGLLMEGEQDTKVVAFYEKLALIHDRLEVLFNKPFSHTHAFVQWFSNASSISSDLLRMQALVNVMLGDDVSGPAKVLAFKELLPIMESFKFTMVEATFREPIHTGLPALSFIGLDDCDQDSLEDE